MSNNHTFIIKQGKTFNRRLEYRTGDPPSLFDFNGYEARMQIRPTFNSTTIYCSLSSSIGADETGLTMTPLSGSTVLPRSSGSIGIKISAFSSSLFTFTEGVFDLEIYSGSGVTQYVEEILRGKVKILQEVTR